MTISTDQTLDQLYLQWRQTRIITDLVALTDAIRNRAGDVAGPVEIAMMHRLKNHSFDADGPDTFARWIGSFTDYYRSRIKTKTPEPEPEPETATEQ